MAAANRVLVRLSEQEFRRLLAGEEVVIENMRTQLTARAGYGDVTLDVDVHLVRPAISLARLWTLVVELVEQAARASEVLE